MITVLFDNTKTTAGALLNGRPPTITLPQPTLVASIRTLHVGATADHVALKDVKTGAQLGPYPVRGALARAGWPTMDSVSEPNVIVPAGSYEILDSSPAQWAQNAASGGEGFTIVEGQPAAMGRATQLFTNSNTAPVSSSSGIIALVPTFVLSQTTLITTVEQYHYNNGAGAAAVGVTLGSAFAAYGPFPAVGSPGTGGKLLNWTATLNIELPPGVYHVGSTSMSTWSFNDASESAGFVTIFSA
jgi:hypothetical protein